MALPGSAPRAARGPPADSPITSIIGLAAGGVLGPGLRRLAILLSRRGTPNVAVPVTIPALGGTPAPLAHHPLGLAQHRAPRPADGLVAILTRGRHCDIFADGALGGLLALHGAFGAGTLLRPLAMPLALGFWAHGLAPHAVVAAIHGAFGVLTAGGTLGGVAVEGLGAVADILLGTKHSAIRLSALDLAPLVGRGTQLGASCLALRDAADRLAVLLANWLRALPGAMGYTTLPLVQRHNGRRQRWLVILLFFILFVASRRM
mmetsp:Transcript_58388/g.125627  ORF Transcript_58388/g.125627 Transcript_58388/m.125627 type:complete len:262 (-) Transcript_58388:444-1229(-)